ncbi:olfactory receptor 476 [Camelus ferus]|uniref:Olfactory receptor 476 n=1 Tax=Camelus ferus TaxID=419612 RepID=A0A8B8TVQ7_CAMFR|nr:olfactory receptor 476 [Camelus ferus]
MHQTPRATWGAARRSEDSALFQSYRVQVDLTWCLCSGTCPTVENCTPVARFLLLGLTEQARLKGILFVPFLFVYLVTLTGNLAMITLIHTDPQLHTPMYFFLSVLSFIDSSFSTVNTPRLLESFLTSGQSISFAGCVVQMALMTLNGTAKCLLLATMAYDRFAAICHPLLYHTIMSQSLCVQLVAATYTASAAISALLTGYIFKLPYCGPNIINHYFCDLPTVLQLAYADTAEVEFIIFSSSATIILFTITIILVSYAYMLVTICRMHSLKAQSKALSTCASHLTVICLFYGTITFTYTQPRSPSSMEQNKVVSVFYTVVIPMLDPLIYSLRNKDVKAALKRR